MEIRVDIVKTYDKTEDLFEFDFKERKMQLL